MYTWANYATKSSKDNSFFNINYPKFVLFYSYFLNYNSLRGTDYNRYGKYLDYFVKNNSGDIGLESGVIIFILYILFNYIKKPLFISNVYEEPVYSLSIQLGNSIFSSLVYLNLLFV